MNYALLLGLLMTQAEIPQVKYLHFQSKNSVVTTLVQKGSSEGNTVTFHKQDNKHFDIVTDILHNFLLNNKQMYLSIDYTDGSSKMILCYITSIKIVKNQDNYSCVVEYNK